MQDHPLHQHPEVVGVAAEGLERGVHRFPVGASSGDFGHRRQDVVDEWFAKGRQVDRRREVEERRLAGGEHRGQAFAARTREHRLQLVRALVEASSQRRDERFVVFAAGKLLHFVKH